MIGATKILQRLINGAAKNSTIHDDPYCKRSATSGDPYSLQKFCSPWWTRLHNYNPWWPILQIFWTSDDPYSVRSLMTHSAEILQFLMTHTAKILQLLKTHTHCRNSAVAEEPGCINIMHDDPYCRYSEPLMTHTQCRNFVASDYPGCMNSTINDDPTGHRNYATPANCILL